MKKKILKKLFTYFSIGAILVQSLSPFSFLSKNLAYAEDLTPTETPILEETTTSTTTTIPELTITPTPEIVNNEIVEPTISLEPQSSQPLSQWTFEKVELNKEYVAPQNSGVKIIFTKLPDPAGNIKIEEITLTEEQIEKTGALSDKAYDITSDMKDGEFNYALSLPIPESSRGKEVEVKFAEELSKIEEAKKVENNLTKTDTSVSVSNLDHLTIFIITDNVVTSSSTGVNAVTPSTNDINRTNSWAHVDQLSQGVGTTDLQFISTRGFYSCFEYRTDGDTSQVLSENGGVNYNTDITDGLYPYVCENNSNEILTIPANEYVEVRMVFGAERDERFDWTRFDVLPAPFERSATITSPLAGTNVSGTVSFDATLVDKDGDDNIQWAVRKGTCTAGTNTVFGNVDGKHDAYDWDGYAFHASADTSSWIPGDYCFIFNPTESAEDTPIRETSEFTLNDTKAPLVTIESPNKDDVVSGEVKIYGTVLDDYLLSHYNISVYPGDADFNDFSKRIAQSTVYLTSNINNELIFNWDSTTEEDGKYLIRLAARDKAGNRDLVAGKEYTGGDDSQHVIKVTINNTPPSTPTGIYFKDTKNNKNIYCGGLTSARNFDVYWDENTEPDFHHYEYISYNADGSTGPIREFTTAYFNASWWTVPIEGTYGVQVRAVDKAGNKSEWSGGAQGFNNSCKYTSDWTSPTITNLNVDKAFVKAGDVIVINADVTDASGITAVSADFSYNASYTNRPSPTSVSMSHTTGDIYEVSYTVPSSWNDGIMYIKVAARDKTGGNWIRSLETKTVEVDNTEPVEPTASPGAGDYDSDQIVTLSSSDAGSGLDKIYYTLDGTEPDNTKTEHTGAITIDHDLTLKAIAYDKLGNASTVLSAHYGVPPVIFGETQSRVDDTIAIITWSTDDPSTSRVVYDTVSHPTLGTSPNFGYAYSTSEDSAKVTSHSVTVTGLTVGTTYYFRPISHGSPEAIGKELSFTPHYIFGLPGDGLSDGGSDGKSDGGSTGGPSAVSPAVLGVSTLAYGGLGGGEVLGVETQEEDKDLESETEENEINNETINEAGKDVLGEATDTDSSIWQNTFYRWLIIIIAIVVVALLYLLFFRRKKDKNKEA